jgi:hypothetical protein
VGLIGKKTGGGAKVKRAVLEAAKASLFPRRDHVAKQLARLGLSSKQLTSQELVELLYDIYNPAPTGTQRIILDSTAYTAPLVEPAIENPAPAAADSDSARSAKTDNPNFGEAGRQAAGLMPHTQIKLQPQAVTDSGLRPVPPRGDNGGNGRSEESDESENQKVGGSDIPASPSYAEATEGKQIAGEGAGQGQNTASNPQPAGQTPAQTDALQKLQKAVEEAAKLSGGISKAPSGGLDLRGDISIGDSGAGDKNDPGGFKI